MTDDDFRNELGRLADQYKTDQKIEQDAQRKIEENRKDALVAWRETCKRVILPMFHEVADHPDFNTDDGPSATVKDDDTRVSLRVNQERLSLEFDSREQKVILHGYPRRAGLSGEYTTEARETPMHIDASWLRSIVKDFVRMSLGVKY